MSRSRLEAFTDGVIAIIITILVLELHLPDRQHTWSALVQLVPVFIAYVLSFLVIAGFWISHHTVMLQTKTVTISTLWANLHFLFWLSLMPALTAWYGSDIFSRPAALLFQVDVIAVNLAFVLLRKVIRNSNTGVFDPGIKKEWLSFGINVITLVVAMIYPPLLFLGLALNSFLWLIPISHELQTVAAEEAKADKQAEKPEE